MPETEFIVMTSAAKMPKARRPYLNVAVCEVRRDIWPRMISEHARGMVRIVRHYGRQSTGTTEQCQYRRTLAIARLEAAKLNTCAVARECGLL